MLLNIPAAGIFSVDGSFLAAGIFNKIHYGLRASAFNLQSLLGQPIVTSIDTIILRMGNPDDYHSLAEVMFEAVRSGTSLYTPEQREAWVPVIRQGQEWTARLAAQRIFLAQQADEICGFLSLADAGYIDLAFIRPRHQGTGLFRRLYRELEQTAIGLGETRLWVHASLMARPAFAAVGFTVVNEQSVEIRGQILQRFEMQKAL